MTSSILFALFATLALAGGAAAQTNLPSTSAPRSTVIVEEVEFKQQACMNKANGSYCGLGSNRQLLYQCTDGQIVHQTPCAGGCDPNTLACKTEFGVKGIDQPKPQ
ncbi:MAG: hypothetical protein JNM30_04780 [Rhodospirillales bacterium]|nr:hypothetical protein [Rhodospirillales bacterium]